MGREFRVIERTHCPVCQGRRSSSGGSLHDDRYGQPDLYDLRICKNPSCGLVFLKQTVASEDIPALYAKYYHHHRKRGFSKPLEEGIYLLKRVRDAFFNIDNFYRQLIPGQRVLDVGCGYGPPLSFIKKKSIQWKGLEIDPGKAAANRQRGLNCLPLFIDELAASNRQKYDAVIVNQVIEHVVDPIGFMKAMHALLAPSAIAYVSTPNYDSKYRSKYGLSWIHWHVPYHQMYFSQKSVRYLAKRTGLRFVDFYTRTPFPFFLLQHNLKPISRGQRNPTFNEKISLRHLKFFIDLGNYFSTHRHNEDCLYVRLRRA